VLFLPPEFDALNPGDKFEEEYTWIASAAPWPCNTGMIATGRGAALRS
jgi:hypothetical protein